MRDKSIIIDGTSLTIEDVVRVARGNARVSLSPLARNKCEKSSRWIEKMGRGKSPIYGVNTGFGSKEGVRIPEKDLQTLQRNLILSHSAGVGEILDRETVRAMMLLRANALSTGFSGVRPFLIENILSLLNDNVYPVVPEKGSVGASGDLAPLSHLALLLIGEGNAFIDDKKVSAARALKHAGIAPISLAPKEGLALINGNQLSTGIGVITLYDCQNLFSTALTSAGLALEALLAHKDAFCPEYLRTRPQEGVMEVSKSITSLLEGSQLIGADRGNTQDAYSLRCIPQVYGTVLSSMMWVKNILKVEINSATDNPLIFPGLDAAISGCNFHGEPIAVAMDLLGIVTSNLGNITERQIMRLLSSFLSKGLPSFLAKKEGLESGYMLAQYSAAALVSENKVLSHPASCDSIPTSEDQEDYVSMAPIAARKAREIFKNTRSTVAIELLCSAEAVDIRTKGDFSLLGGGTRVVQELIREKIPPLTRDRIVSRDIKLMEELIEENEILDRIKDTGIILLSLR
ncbi:histidine ammonia-lyase [candidate division WOR-3 bacterium JGI_Cruoil_03_44_89]|uniref:Histidine ammonia-lyase n=1 Tax=candidate division WOR-3 bacterium JGI_Cruoil_03_44_89 TaxID=1973748 RepID=A0A235BTF1_UNCW3|nr:MAG: histidine ammonia-lyase [candidate division WOR-3 bacterium JGI_Cruoil_03_44_89]